MCLLVVASFSLRAEAQGPTDAVYEWIQDLMVPSRSMRQLARDRVLAAADRSLIPPLVDALFFTPKPARRELLDVLEALTSQRFQGYYDWVRYLGSQTGIQPGLEYLVWKGQLLSRIDPRYAMVFYPGAPTRIRIEEIVWGGVPLAGIPALDDPPVMAGSSARYLSADEKVFGLTLGHEARAYPLRILSWHELVNDHLAGEPITLSFCTLCGSGVFYRAREPGGDAIEFDTSGLLYRSNKLMVDRSTFTLWSNLTGTPVVGRLADTTLQLEMLAGTLTSWQAWLERHPSTTVLDMRGIERRLAPRFRYDYRPGAADRARLGVSFPVWLQSTILERDREVYGLRAGGAAKAYPVDRLLARGLLLDEVGGLAVVLVADRRAGAVRAYRRDSEHFRLNEVGEIVDADGRRWSAGETGMIPVDGSDRQPLERLPGHVALWFGWYAFFPETEVWKG